MFDVKKATSEVVKWIQDFFEEIGKGCNAVIGISGGLDSTLALLVTAKAFDILGIDRKGIEAVTMPCFGTTDRTYQNACLLTEKMGAALREVNIKNAVRQHFVHLRQKRKDDAYSFILARTKVLQPLMFQMC